jgi:hypothetical protein
MPTRSEKGKTSGDANNRKAQGGGPKSINGGGVANVWINGHDGSGIAQGGSTPADDSGMTSISTLAYPGILAGKGLIEDQGFDPTNIIMYTSGKGIRDLTLDPNLDSYISFSRPAILTEATVERIAGVNLVRTSGIATLAGGGVATGRRAVMFIPGVSFGLVTGRDLTMEAQRRNEFQFIHLTGTQKLQVYVKVVESTVGSVQLDPN